MNILGISAFYHDSAACLVRDGRIVAAAQEERFTRRKHDSSLPKNAIAYCLREGGIEPKDLDLVGFYEKPLLKFDRLLETFLAVAPRGWGMFARAIPLWLSDRLWVADHLEKALGCDLEVTYCPHHVAHAASAFFPSPFEEAAILTADAVGEWTTTATGAGRGNRIEMHSEIRFPHSLGMFYSAFTYYAGFRVNSGEYKLMGLAPYGEPRYVQKILDEIIDVKDDGSFRLNMEYFGYLTSPRMINGRFERLFEGPPRRPDAPITRRDLDIARSVQDVTEMVLLRMAHHLYRETGLANLCMAGGVALNCVANGRILRETPFERLFVQPAAGDAGGALGVALHLWHEHLGHERPPSPDGRDAMQGALLGPSFSDDEIRAFLDGRGVPYEVLDRAALLRRAAKLIAEGNVVGWFQGRMEFGPRALGSRSILADPRNPEMQKVLNLKIKFRESFRPFAPSVLLEHAQEYFELGGESPYMLLTAQVQPDKRKETPLEAAALEGLDKLRVPRSVIPAVTHVDDSARVQTVRRQDNPIYHDLLAEFHRLTGCPVLVNTSFNVRGEPIVCAPRDAFQCFLRTAMDYLVMGCCLLDKTKMPDDAVRTASQQVFTPD